MATATPAPDLQQLNNSFAIPGVAQIVSGNNRLPKVRITSAAASADIYLHGAHLTSWIPAGGQEVLFLSERAQFQDGKAIRGGVPICFPWFNAKSNAKDYDPPAPPHGFVRTRSWQIDSILHEGNNIAVSLSTGHDAATQPWWPHEFRAVQRITVGANLRIELTVTNTGATPLTFEEALHTYYRVGDVRQVSLARLDGVSYLDNTQGNIDKLQHGDNLFTQRIDNAYFNTEAELVLTDPALNRRIHIGKRNSLNTVVWNPWAELARGMADLGDEEWPHFLCVEAANIRAIAISLKPGEQHTMSANIRVERLE